MSSNIDAKYKEVAIAENGGTDTPRVYGYGVRHVQIFLTFLSLCVVYASRAHIGVTIVAMTTKPTNTNNTNLNYIVLVTKISNESENSAILGDLDIENSTSKFGVKNDTETKLDANVHKNEDQSNTIETYDWPKSTQEMILGAFFFGYSVTMFPMGLVCQRYGGKLPIQIGLAVNGVASILTPWLVSWGTWKAVCACRVLQGLSQAGFYPAIASILSKWSHPSERGKFITFIYTGGCLGTVIAFQLGGALAESRFGWPATFWAMGALCVAMFIVMSVFGAATPAEHKTISYAEKEFIMGKVDGVKKNQKVPWKAIMTSRYVWATIVTHIGSGLAYVFFFNQVPSYIHYILKVNVKKSGLLSSLPYISGFFMNLVCGLLSDFCLNRKIMSVANNRRLFNSIGEVGIALTFMAVCYTTNLELAVACLVLALSFHAAVHTGWMLNHIDLAPNFSGTLMAVGNTITCFTSLVIPVIVSAVVTDMENQYQWRIVFLSMAAVAFITNAIFVIFMSSDTQPWNDYGYEKTETEEKLK